MIEGEGESVEDIAVVLEAPDVEVDVVRGVPVLLLLVIELCKVLPCWEAVVEFNVVMLPDVMWLEVRVESVIVVIVVTTDEELVIKLCVVCAETVVEERVEFDVEPEELDSLEDVAIPPEEVVSVGRSEELVDTGRLGVVIVAGPVVFSIGVVKEMTELALADMLVIGGNDVGVDRTLVELALNEGAAKAGLGVLDCLTRSMHACPATAARAICGHGYDAPSKPTYTTPSHR